MNSAYGYYKKKILGMVINGASKTEFNCGKLEP